MHGQWDSWSVRLMAARLGGSLCALGQGTKPQPAPPQSPPASSPEAGSYSPGTAPRRTLEAQAELRRIASQINLTPEQREKLRPIVNAEGEQLSAVRLNEYMTPEQKRAKLEEIRDTFRPKIAEVLTPEQQDK